LNRSTIIAGAGIAATIAILVSVVYTSGAYKLIKLPVRQQALNCLPSDFPTYGGMTIVQAGYELGQPAPGDTTSCSMTFASKARYSDVRDFYRKSLNTGGWTTTAVLGGSDSMDIHFVRDERAQSYGFVSVMKAVATEVRVSFFD
jgi:hypothetical protein